MHASILKSQPRTRHTREPDPTHSELKAHNHTNQQLTNAPSLTFTRTHTHLPNGDRCQRTPPRMTARMTATLTLSHPHARARSPVEPWNHRLRELHRLLREQ